MSFLKDDFYFCEHCNQYSMVVVFLETSFYEEFVILKCSICGEIYEQSILINY